MRFGKDTFMFYAILLCTVASLATGAGGLIVAVWPHISQRTLSVFQGFAAGVMITVSFINMLPNSFADFSQNTDNIKAVAAVASLFALGWLLSLLIEQIAVPGIEDEDTGKSAIRKMCVITTAVIVLHNLPEGMLTSFSGFSDRQLGLRMAVAVALHNIPEGVAVASAVVCLTSSKIKAVAHSFAAGMAELAGGVSALVLLHGFITPHMLNCVLAVISGVMVQVSLCQLIPNGAKMHSLQSVVWGTITGSATISLGILMI